MFVLPQFWNAFYSGYSGNNIYDYWIYLGYNSFFTEIPLAMKMLYDEDIDLDLENYPSSAQK